MKNITQLPRQENMSLNDILKNLKNSKKSLALELGRYLHIFPTRIVKKLKINPSKDFEEDKLYFINFDEIIDLQVSSIKILEHLLKLRSYKNEKSLIQEEESHLLLLQEAVTYVVNHYNEQCKDTLDPSDSGSSNQARTVRRRGTKATSDSGNGANISPDSSLNPPQVEESASSNLDEEHFCLSVLSSEPVSDNQDLSLYMVINVTSGIICEYFLVVITTNYTYFSCKIYDPGGSKQ